MTGGTSARVHIARPNDLADSGWFAGVHDIQVAGTSPRTDEALRACRATRPDVLVVHSRTPRNPVELVAAARDERLAPSVVIGDQLGARTFLGFACAGASGFATAAPGELTEAVRCVAEGEVAFSSDLTRTLVGALRQHERASALRSSGPLNRLTPREWEVLDWLREGLSTAQIAERLYVTPSTVRGYVARIMQALHAHSRQEALAVVDRLFMGDQLAPR